MCFRPVAAKKRENICPKCKKVNEPATTICTACGTKLIAPPGQPGGTAPPRPPGAPPKPPSPPGEQPKPKSPGEQ
jgi:hypothetical protein